MTFTTNLFYAGMVDSHVCNLQERFDRLSEAKLWALPRKELCLCQGVVAPQMSGSRNCPRRTDTDALEDLWLTDDPSLITLLTNRNNWTPAKLDNLLGRSHCCKLCFKLMSIVVKDNIKHIDRFKYTLENFRKSRLNQGHNASFLPKFDCAPTV